MGIRYWLGVVHRANVRRGVAMGMTQAQQSSRETLGSMRESDGLVYYSPRTDVDGAVLREFTAIGWIADSPVPQPAGSDYLPWRRRVDYEHDAVATSIRPLLPILDLSRGNPDWGVQLRRGLLQISRHDFDEIRRQMRRPSPDER
ncbi:EVE domain-containing protein [Glaciibacter psychrotolerans]|uniref:EVE domain-containing protein n=1 Tax=Glaciibacter psychrotolerans TaxID=670054 RepID=A0A7Z0EH23_9MICO|nr:hypothetical protein [Leifsonia psychrotolerans]